MSEIYHGTDEDMDISKIMDLLPHRYPFILIDRVLEIIPGEKIVALKNVTMNENFFQGHFPGKPIMPGVIIIEALAQASGVLLLKSVPHEENEILYFTGIDKVRFRKPVIPGDQLILEAKITHLRAKVSKMTGRVLVGENVVAEGTLMAAIGE